MHELEVLFKELNNEKLTENGDLAYKSSNNDLVDILFTAPYLEKHLHEVSIGDTNIEKLFSMFMRDPRHGMGRRDLGRELMKQTNVDAETVIHVGRFDDLYNIFGFEGDVIMFGYAKDNALAKKWLPRYTSGKASKARAIKLMNHFNLSIQEYQKFIKTDTIETLLNSHKKDFLGNTIYDRRDEINFEHIPSLARLKWSKKLQTIPGYADYMEKVSKGEAKINFKVANAYDVVKNLQEEKISPKEADIYWNKINKVEMSVIPIIDVSGSMYDDNDSINKALSVGLTLAEGSTYAKDMFITFSAAPQLEKIKGDDLNEKLYNLSYANWGWSTNLGKVFDLLRDLNKYPEYLVVLSDMEFDSGSRGSKDQLMNELKSKGIDTKIIWWNFNSRNITLPETDKYGNIFMSGYNTQLLELLENGMDAEKFLYALLRNYAIKISK